MGGEARQREGDESLAGPQTGKKSDGECATKNTHPEKKQCLPRPMPPRKRSRSRARAQVPATAAKVGEGRECGGVRSNGGALFGCHSNLRPPSLARHAVALFVLR